ncbi:MAG: hypothetical protein ABI560_07920 [Myxococcales bacterium]
MSSWAVAARLRDMSRQRDARGFIAKGVDMSVPAVTTRLRTLAALSDMCLRLMSIGRGLAPATKNEMD